jgi:uncharacterized protein (TIGR02996 family)
MAELEQALEALARGDDEAALGLLLAAWRACRAPRVADLIERVSARITTARGAIEGRRVRDRHRRWLEIEERRDSADLERLLHTGFPRSWKEGLRWLQRLHDWPDDPRIATGLVAQLGHKPYTSMGSMPYWRSLLSLLVRQRDVRAIPGLRQGNPDEFNDALGYRRLFADGVAQLEAAFPDGAPEVPPDRRAACAAVERLIERQLGRRQAETATEEDLLAEIFAAPEEDAPRLVFADWLGERGDARGELIVLQCARAGTAQSPGRRERSLLREHADAWCGPLLPVLRREGRVFERGFLAACIGCWDRYASVFPLVGEPHWATVRELTCPPFHWGRGGAPLQLLLHPVMRSLRVVHNVSSEDALTIARSELPPPLEELGFAHPARLGEAGWAALGRAPGLPALRRLVLTAVWGAHELEGLWRSPLVERLESLTVVVSQLVEHLPAYLAAAADHAPRSLRRFTVMDLATRWPSRPEGWWLSFTRDERGRLTRLAAEFGATVHYGFGIVGDRLAHALDRLPHSGVLTAITVTRTRAFKPSADQQAGLAAACRRFEGLERLELPFEG